MKRRVARYDQPADYTEIPEDPIEPDNLQKIMAALELDPDRQYLVAGEYKTVVGIEYIAGGIQEYAGEYLRSCDQPPPARETVRYHLECLSEMIECHVQAPADEADLLAWLDGMVPEARDALIPFIGMVPSEIGPSILSGELGWSAVLDAVHLALAKRRGGDIKDPNLYLAVQNLVDLYQKATGEAATWSGKPVGAYGIDGGIQRIGQTACAHFIHAFFQAVDPEIAPSRIDNYMRSLLARRRRDQPKQRA